MSAQSCAPTPASLDALLGQPERLALLASTGLMDSASEEAFDRLTGLASRFLNASMALVSLVDDRRQFFKSARGVNEPWASRRETPLSHSFCKYVVGTRAPLIVENAREHELLRDSPAIEELGVIAYAGIPLLNEEHALGSLCVADSTPRRWSTDEVVTLRELAAEVMSEIELRLKTRALQQAEQDRERELREARHTQESLAQSQALFRAVAENLPNGALFLFDRDLRCLLADGELLRLALGSAQHFVGKSLHDIVSPENLPHVEEAYRRALAGEVSDTEVSRGGKTFEVRAIPVEDGRGRVHACMGLSYDVTLRNQSEQVLRKAELAKREQAARIALLQGVADAANSAGSSREALAACLRLTREYTDFAVGHALVREDDSLVSTRLWQFRAEDERFAKFRASSEALRFARGTGTIGQVLASGKPYVVADLQREAGFLRAPGAAAGGLVTCFAFPVLVGSEVVAVLEFFDDDSARLRGELEDLIASVGVQLGRVFERERTHALLEAYAENVRALSLRDELTGLYNRRGFLEVARQQLLLADRSGKEPRLVYVDLDGMKIINDRLGPEQGDLALCEAAALLRSTFRASDVVARLGGDEFVVLAIESHECHEKALLERAERALASFNRESGAAFELAFSVGIALRQRGESIETLIARADTLMYEKKRARSSGRGSVLR
ncbi:MAG: diguanylate cyclase [Myxococcota bacterium]